MNAYSGTAKLIKEEGSLLASLLDIEEYQYRRLLRLAWRQNSYMKRQDVDRLATNGREWSRYLPRANEARIARERFLSELSGRLNRPIPPHKVSDLLDYADHGTRMAVKVSMRNLRDTATRLARQNELNRHLAEFCLDLAHEETEIFKRCVLDDPAGCYTGKAKTSDRGPGGVLVRQA